MSRYGKKRNEGSAFSMGTGASSILVIFAILCITVFAILSISSANADSTLSKKTADHVTMYYAADSKAEEILAELRAGNMPDGVIREGDVYKYACEISDTRDLEVEVLVTKDSYSVLRWQTVYTGVWETDDNMNVWGGE